MTKYLLKYHEFYYRRILELKKQIQKLKSKLPHKEFIQHDEVKFAYRLRKASLQVIPEDPTRPEYRLKGELRKFSRYKQGLKRYRLFFTYSKKPPIILYLYINDKNSLRKNGDKNDPYKIFHKLTKQGIFSHDPKDPKIQKWIKEYSQT